MKKTNQTDLIQKILVVVMVIILLLSSMSSWMVQAQAGDGSGEKGIGITTRFDEQETIRVIVQLDVPDQGKAAELMTPAIHKAQSDMISGTKSGFVKVIHEYDYIPFIALEIDRAGFEALQNNPLVVGIEEDILMKPMLLESVPLINADDVWLEGVTGAGQVVAILDTGVDKNHPALVGKVVSEACYSSTEVSEGSTSLCPGEVSVSTATDSGLPCSSITGCDHGTHVAGIVAADGLLFGNPIKGVAPDAKIIAIQVFSKVVDPSFCYPYETCIGSYPSDQLMGLQRVYDLRNTYSIAAINLSLGGQAYTDQSVCDSNNSSYKAKVDLLKSVGIATIAASGNNGFTNAISSPACISSVISVGATTDGDLVASYSNSDDFLDLLAPGSSITSSVPGTGYATWYGTSMATPHVAGAWALLKSNFPGLSVDGLMSVFKNTGVLITDVNDVVTARIDAFGAFEFLFIPAPENVLASDGELQESVDVDWDTVIDAINYEVFRNPVNDPVTATRLVTNYVTNSFVDTTASEGTIYYYWVKACNANGCSKFSESNNGWRGYDVIPPPEGVSSSDGEFTDKVQVSWYGVGGAASYTVFRNIENSFAGAIELVNQPTSPYDDLTAEPGETYYYWVIACSGETTCSVKSFPDIGFSYEIFNVFLPLTVK